MAKLKLREGEGWILETVEELKCVNCKTPIAVPFYWCKKNKIAICWGCEHRMTLKICKPTKREQEHEHFHIIEFK